MKKFDRNYKLFKLIYKIKKWVKGGSMKKKKFLAVLLVMFFMFSGVAFAARTSVSTLIASTTLNADPKVISGTKSVKNADKIACFVTYDETQVGNAISAAVTVEVSPDNSTWTAASFYDYAGGATLQTSETISDDGNYYFWMNRDLAMPYVKVTITATNTDADDIAVVSAQIITQE